MIPQDVFGLAAALMLYYGLDDLALIESTCLQYRKKSKFILLIVFDFRGEYTINL
jgi:hypothetical protein